MDEIKVLGFQNMIWDMIQGQAKSMLLMKIIKKKRVTFRSQNDYTELEEKVF